MSNEKNTKYLVKTTSFGGNTLTLFSIDGVTWSSRKDELLKIKERQEKERISLDPTKVEEEEIVVEEEEDSAAPIAKLPSSNVKQAKQGAKLKTKVGKTKPKASKVKTPKGKASKKAKPPTSKSKKKKTKK